MLIYNKIYSQQILSKKKGLLKRKGKRHTTTAFLFLFASKCFVNGFVERLLSVYITGHQCVIFPYQQFNTFSTLNKPPGKRQRGIPPFVGWSDGLPSCRPMRKSRCRWQKEKGDQCPPTPPQAFGEQKAIAH